MLEQGNGTVRLPNGLRASASDAARARFVRVCPGDTAARSMIMWIPQLISC
jgi:hypothetical protein